MGGPGSTRWHGHLKAELVEDSIWFDLRWLARQTDGYRDGSQGRISQVVAYNPYSVAFRVSGTGDDERLRRLTLDAAYSINRSFKLCD